MSGKRIDGYLICGGKYHDMDYARLELLQHLAEDERIRVRVAEDYSDGEAIRAADFLLTYTCERVPEDSELPALGDFLGAGKRWFALHGTNSILRYRKDAGWEAPRRAPQFMDMLGSQFLAHPPIAPYTVTITNPEHPLTRGLGDFEAEDELYLCEMHGEHELLMETRWTGTAPGFVAEDWSEDRPRPVLYLRRWGGGEVLYFTLGHARGRYDMQPLMDEYPRIERGSWPVPEFREVVRRGIRWAIGEL